MSNFIGDLMGFADAFLKSSFLAIPTVFYVAAGLAAVVLLSYKKEKGGFGSFGSFGLPAIAGLYFLLLLYGAYFFVK